MGVGVSVCACGRVCVCLWVRASYFLDHHVRRRGAPVPSRPGIQGRYQVGGGRLGMRPVAAGAGEPVPLVEIEFYGIWLTFVNVGGREGGHGVLVNGCDR